MHGKVPFYNKQLCVLREKLQGRASHCKLRQSERTMPAGVIPSQGSKTGSLLRIFLVMKRTAGAAIRGIS